MCNLGFYSIFVYLNNNKSYFFDLLYHKYIKNTRYDHIQHWQILSSLEIFVYIVNIMLTKCFFLILTYSYLVKFKDYLPLKTYDKNSTILCYPNQTYKIKCSICIYWFSPFYSLHNINTIDVYTLDLYIFNP